VCTHLAGVRARERLTLRVEVSELQETELAQLRDGLVSRIRRHDELQTSRTCQSLRSVVRARHMLIGSRGAHLDELHLLGAP
jgi:hypothetical protein